MTSELQKEELAVYDRQLRLWGFEAQKKLKSSKVLLINLTACNSELARHLVFSGISVCLFDQKIPAEGEKWTNFLLSQATKGESRAAASARCLREMNSFVGIDCVAKNPENLAQFNAIVLDANLENLKEIFEWDEMCAKKKIPLFIMFSAGFNGYVYTNLSDKNDNFQQLSQYLEKVKTMPADFSKMPKIKRKQWANLLFHSFVCKFANLTPEPYFANLNKNIPDLKQKTMPEMTDLYSKIGKEFNPVAAVIGALVGQQIGQFVAGAKGYQKMVGVTIYDSEKQITNSFGLDSLI